MASPAVIRLLKTLLVLTVLSLLATAACGLWWLQQPLAMPAPVRNGALLDLNIPPGASARTVAQAVADAGVEVSPFGLFVWFRLSGDSRQIKAGSYEFDAQTTPVSLLDKLVRGEQAMRSVTLIEGWNIRQVLQALQDSPDLTQDVTGLSGAALMARLGYPGRHPEGRFFPDTYRVPKNTPASDVLKLAAQTMEQQLSSVWAQRHPAGVLRSADEALILASIIEKETGLERDRAMIAGVFHNRLRLGMRLQTDPSVIYGLGKQFDGNIRRKDLQTDTPYNTYTRAGLPPTPIAMPGRSSLLAAVQPANTRALYFVAQGGGGSYFSETLAQHNAAVRRYILQR
ncbi:MAG: hypothetical protein RLZZ352_500 [Pseudomonadota bacterium]|jgi:UPF0755 protein